VVLVYSYFAMLSRQGTFIWLYGWMTNVRMSNGRMSNGQMSNVVKKAECRTAECRTPNVERQNFTSDPRKNSTYYT
jgi:hypothetical protein